MSSNHLISFVHDSSFAVWREVVVRTAGFPCTWATELHSEETVAAAAAYGRVRERRDQIVGEMKRALHGRRRDGAEDAEGLLKELKRLERENATHEQIKAAESGALREVAGRVRELSEASLALEEAHDRELMRLKLALQKIMSRGRLREAIAWQSLGALEGVDKFVDCQPSTLNKKKAGSARNSR
jgi:hypothetical protein